MLAYHLYDYLITLQAFRIIRKWIRPIIGGLLMKIMVMLLLAAYRSGNYFYDINVQTGDMESEIYKSKKL